MLLRSVLNNTQNETQDVLVEVSSGRALSAAGLCAWTGRLLGYFNNIGLNPGDTVSVCVENSLESAALMVALFEAPVKVVLLNTLLHGRELDELLVHCDTKLFITSPQTGAKLTEQSIPTVSAEEIFSSEHFCQCNPDAEYYDPEAPKYIFFSSGTTGNPKGIMLSRAFVETRIKVLMDTFAFERGCNYLSFIPFFVSLGLVPSFFAPLALGCKLYIDHFNPFIIPRFWDTVKNEKIKYFASVPGLWRMLKNNAAHPSSKEIEHVRRVFCSSAPMPPDILDWLHSLGIKICNCLGMSETASYFCISAPETSSAQCVGAPAGCRVEIFDESGNILPVGQSGEICVEPPTCPIGYFKAPDLTEQVMRFGWFHTGDIGKKDTDGNVYIVDRKKHIVIKNGFNIFPAEVDAVMARHPKVKECACFGVADEEYGEKLVCAFVAGGDCQTGELKKYAIEKMPQLMVPDVFFCVPEIPKAANGKTKVRPLREKYLNV